MLGCGCIWDFYWDFLSIAVETQEFLILFSIFFLEIETNMFETEQYFIFVLWFLFFKNY